jgi:hypothetical protein
MEYPTFITSLSFWGIGSWLRLAEQATIHEFGHQYFYGLLATNEFEDPWMDEGINEYMEARIMDQMYGSDGSVLSVLGFHVGDFQLARAGYAGMKNPSIAPLTGASWKIPGQAYGPLVYYKTAVVLKTLERMIGCTTMDTILSSYYRQWRFRHPTPKDFLNVVNEVVRRQHGNRFGKNLDWYFEQTLFGTGVCDFELADLKTNSVSKFAGIAEEDGKSGIRKEPNDSTGGPLYETTVAVNRLGEIILPVEVLVRFSDGKEVRETWDGRDRRKEYRYLRPSAAVFASVDPDDLIPLDINRVNNEKSVAPATSVVWKYTAKILFWMQNLLQIALLFT